MDWFTSIIHTGLSSVEVWGHIKAWEIIIKDNYQLPLTNSDNKDGIFQNC